MSFCDNFVKKTLQWLEFLEKIGFPYLSLKLSLTLPHKGKMLWCSYFRSYIKSRNFSRTGNFIKKCNFVSSALWKIIILLGNSVGALYGLYKGMWVGNDVLFTPKPPYTKIILDPHPYTKIFLDPNPLH